MANDTKALLAWLSAPDRYADDVLPSFDKPYLLISGELDETYPAMAKYSTQLKEGSFVSIPGLNHIPTWQHSELLLPVVRQFLAAIPET